MYQFRHTALATTLAAMATLGLSCSGSGSSLATSLVGGAVAGRATATAGVTSPSGGEPENPGPPERITNVDACARGDVQANLAIAAAFEQSMHELVVCGGMTQRFSMSFFNVLISLAAKTTPTPGKNITHVGDGRYQVGDVMTIRMTLPFATSFGQAGDPIPFDVFDPANYFTKFEVRAIAGADLVSGEASARLALSYEEGRPGLELLGNLITGQSVTLEFDAVVDMLSQVNVIQDIGVDDQRGDAHIVYDVASDPVPMRYFVFGAGAAPITIKSARVTNEKRGQVLQVTDWGMQFSGGSAGTMDGYVDFEVRGGDFDWAGRFVYPHRRTPDTTFTCL